MTASVSAAPLDTPPQEWIDLADAEYPNLQEGDFILFPDRGWKFTKLSCGQRPATSDYHVRPQVACDEIAAADGDFNKLPGSQEECEKFNSPLSEPFILETYGKWHARTVAWRKEFD
ncbi:SSI family serine proteinase inhibitor [Streptomyces sp. CS113]|uniref:SSI family serine proteinase inhibitor n=1 Tax=Streptomyces sp. CS113 TaxID=1982761 RepID=UPI0015C5EF24|nr:SSI family serine proteinase inhibitor [Streptomyces sp. CS113]